MAAKQATTFRLEGTQLDALQKIKERRGISVTEQVTRALDMWIEAMGVPIERPHGGVSMKLDERMQGSGVVLEDNGKRVGSASYDLSVWQEVHHIRTMGGASTMEGLKEIQGTIEIAGEDTFGLVGKNLVLQLQDGRSLPFFFSSSNGAIAARGDLK